MRFHPTVQTVLKVCRPSVFRPSVFRPWYFRPITYITDASAVIPPSHRGVAAGGPRGPGPPDQRSGPPEEI